MTLMLTYLLIAIPFTVGVWGTFWLVRRHRRYTWLTAERRLFWEAIGWCVIILVELTVFVGVAADRQARGEDLTAEGRHRVAARTGSGA